MPTDATSTDPQSGVPALSGPVAPKATTKHRTDEELAHELVELEKQFDPPDPDAIMIDARWFDTHWGTPDFEPYRGTHIAVLNGAIVGHGWNSLQLQIDVARKFNVHPQRFILEYIPTREF
ncbi:hypothetical protein [Frigoriglobus tundricola]|uniref:Uncharacterized protein n=1 Tax=Frigoriglobus tundricola TaxID=2774151 RepID=A0A6M5YU77_9BACT|nr:hypothetical protein [Frigoriglobus tundricola]QJW96863.1 hypothetical protein FTUN_4423 [Frigoriglobus tundricola]